MRYPARIAREVPGRVDREIDGDHEDHRRWIAKQRCVMHGPDCRGTVSACHWRKGSHTGGKEKPHDKRCWPGCLTHHGAQHADGEDTIQQEWGISFGAICRRMWAQSPYGERLHGPYDSLPDTRNARRE